MPIPSPLSRWGLQADFQCPVLCRIAMSDNRVRCPGSTGHCVPADTLPALICGRRSDRSSLQLISARTAADLRLGIAQSHRRFSLSKSGLARRRM